MSKGKDRSDAAILSLILLVLAVLILLVLVLLLVLLALADKDACADEQDGRAICAPIVWTASVNLTLRLIVNSDICLISNRTKD
jgi:hypothetical protein